MDPNNPNHEPDLPAEEPTLVEVPVEEAPIKPRRVRRPRKNRKALYVIVVVVLVLAYFGIAPRLAHARRLDQSVSSVKHEVPVVSVVKLKPTSGQNDLTLPSNIQAIDETILNAQTTGYVRQRFVDIGYKVHQGEVLATIESPEVDQQLQEGQAQVAKGVADLGQSSADAAKLHAAIAAAEADYVRSQASLMEARANLDHLKAKELQAESYVSSAKSKQIGLTKKYAGAQADLNRANAGMTIAKKTLDRWKILLQGDAVSGQDVDEKQADYDGSIAQVEAAQANVSSAQADVEAGAGAVKSAQAEETAAKADVASGAQGVAAAQASVNAAKANIQAAESAYDASQSGIKAASATVESDSANVRRIRALQSFENIVAPFSGVITARNVDVGDLVHPNNGGSGASNPMSTVTKSGLFGLARTDELRVQVNVPEAFVPSVRKGQQADIEVSEYPGKTFPGNVFNVAGALDADSRTLLVEIRVPNPSGILKPGMYAEVHFNKLNSAPVLQIPPSAVVFDAEGTRVAVIQPDGTLHFQTVKPGRDLGNEIEILGGLRGGETIVTNPDDTLTEGEKVRTVEDQR